MKVSILILLVLSALGCGGGTGGGHGSNSSSSPKIRKLGSMAGMDDPDIQQIKKVSLAFLDFCLEKRITPVNRSSRRLQHAELSWRVAILPFLGMDAEYQKFDMTQTWDSEKNRPLIRSKAGQYFVLSNGNLLCTIKTDRPPSKLAAVLDGTSNTIMFIENPNAEIDQWTQPPMMSIDEAVQLVKSLKKDEYLLGACYDGSPIRIDAVEIRNRFDGHNNKDEVIRDLFLHNDQAIRESELEKSQANKNE